jgi:hypothetical protein
LGLLASKIALIAERFIYTRDDMTLEKHSMRNSFAIVTRTWVKWTLLYGRRLCDAGDGEELCADEKVTLEGKWYRRPR